MLEKPDPSDRGTTHLGNLYFDSGRFEDREAGACRHALGPRCTGAAAEIRGTMRLSAPPCGQTSGRDANWGGSSMDHRECADERRLGEPVAGGEGVSACAVLLPMPATRRAG